jgi:molybdenum cofactor cytidylyltransferase
MNSSTLPTLHALVLAAGFSSRLGRPKPLARVRAFSLLRRTLSLVVRFAPAKIVVVIPRQAARYRNEARGLEARGLKIVFAANPRRADGLSSSVRRGIVLARYSSALLLLPVDLADLQPRDVARLISRWRAARRCVIARRFGQQGGAPLILPRWLYSRALEVTGDIGLRDLVSGLPAPQRVLLNLPSAALDVDTPQDLRAARRSLRSSGVSF